MPTRPCQLAARSLARARKLRAIVLWLGGLASLGAATTAPAHPGASTPPGPALGAGITPGRLLIEPRDGVRPLVQAIDKAQDHVFVESYILTDRLLVRALQRAAAQGVQVYVLLDPHPFGMGTQPQHMADELRASGVFVRWSSARFQYTHAKFMVLDDRVAIISSANFSLSGFTRNRDFVVFDRQGRDVYTISAIFRADWDHLPVTTQQGNVVVSPGNARIVFSQLIAAARKSIVIYAEEIADPAMEDRLIRAARRGIRVRVLLAWGATPQGAAHLVRGGVDVRELRAPYIHAKLLSVDGREAFAGSENLSATSLDRDREVGLLLRGGAVRRLDAVFDSDWSQAQRYVPGRVTNKP